MSTNISLFAQVIRLLPCWLFLVLVNSDGMFMFVGRYNFINKRSIVMKTNELALEPKDSSFMEC